MDETEDPIPIQLPHWLPEEALALEKPRWEYGGTFGQVWDGTRLMLEVLQQQEEEQDESLMYALAAQLVLLSQAHVVTLEADQFAALPRTPDDLLDYEPEPHLPFPVLYVSLNTQYTSGILFTAYDERVAATPFMAGGDDWDSAFARTGVPVVWMDLTNHSYYNFIKLMLGDDYDEEDHVGVHSWGMDAAAVMRFLESSNVDIEDQPVSRQVRRHAARKGTPIAQRVYVRSPRHRYVGDRTEHAQIEFSHRFEVRGHYKHYGPDTQLFRATQRDRPHKIINHPTRGQIVRIWCPDFVKGPDDKVLVPKTRVYKKEE